MAWKTAFLLGACVAGMASATTCPSVDDPLVYSPPGPHELSFTSEHYQSSQDCGWLLVNDNSVSQCSEDKIPVVQLTFAHFDSEYFNDYLIMYDGADPNFAPNIGSFSGTADWDSPGVVTTTDSSMYLWFHSNEMMDGGDGHLGFSATIDFVCADPPPPHPDNCAPVDEPIVLHGEGTLVFTPEQYITYAECGWLIANTQTTGYEGREEDCPNPQVQLEFTAFDTEPQMDTLAVYDGAHDAVASLGRFSGNGIWDSPGTQTSSGDSFFLHFHSDGGNANRAGYQGFTMNYRSVCGEDVALGTESCPHTDEPRVFTPDSEEMFLAFTGQHYQSGLDCSWTIVNTMECANNDAVVEVEFTMFHTETDFDYVGIYDGEQSVGIYSGTRLLDSPGYAVSTTNEFGLTFHSDHSSDGGDGYEGFNVAFNFVCASDIPEPQANCPSVEHPNHLEGVPGTLDYSATHYEADSNCGWLISNTIEDESCPYQVVALDFVKFHTETLFDYVEIFDGADNQAPKLGSWSGTEVWDVPLYQRSTGRDVFIEFHSDGTLHGEAGFEGFLLNYNFVCASDETPLTDFDCSDSDGKEYVTIFSDRGLFDRSTPPQTLLFGHHHVPFSLGYPSVSEQLFTNPTEISMLRSFGQDGLSAWLAAAKDEVYATNTCCGALDMSEPWNNVTDKVAICGRGDCLYTDKVRVAQAHGAVGIIVIFEDETPVRMVGEYVDDLVIPSMSVLRSVGDFLLEAAAQANIGVTMGQFECPGLPDIAETCPPLNEPHHFLASGTARSLDFSSDKYTSSMDCGWVMTNDMDCGTDSVPVVEVTFTRFDSEYFHDYAVLFDGSNQFSNLLGEFSGTADFTSPGIFRSSGNSMYLQFHSNEEGIDGSHGHLGFAHSFEFKCQEVIPDRTDHCWPTYDPIVLGADGTMEGTLEFTMEHYEANQDCGWLFINEQVFGYEGHEAEVCAAPVIELDFTGFDIEPSLDYLALYDGPSDMYYTMGRFSGGSLWTGPGYQRSSSNAAFMHFHTDAEKNGEASFEGFTLEWKLSCADHLPLGTETCPDYDTPRVFTPSGEDRLLAFTGQHYMSGLDCTWIIQNTDLDCPNNDPVVQAEFTTFHTEHNYDYVVLYDADEAHEGDLVGMYTGTRSLDGPGFITSESNSLMIHFHSDSSGDGGNDYEGFDVHFDFTCASDITVPESICPALGSDDVVSDRRSTTSKTVGRLEFGTEHYVDNVNCGWLINEDTVSEVPDCGLYAPVIAVDFLTFDTEILLDYVTLFDGSNPAAPILGSFSGSKAWDAPGYLRSSGPELLLEFHSDGSLSGEYGQVGFTVDFRMVCPDEEWEVSQFDCSISDGENHLVLRSEIPVYEPRTSPATPLMYNHHIVPLAIGEPVMYEQDFTNPNPLSLLSNGMVSGEAVFAKDEGFATSMCCYDLDLSDSENDVRGKIGICERGGCLYSDKIRVLQNSGAIGAIIIAADETPIRMIGDTVYDITIPSVSVLASFGELLMEAWTQSVITVDIGPYSCEIEHAGVVPTVNPVTPTLDPVTKSPETSTDEPITPITTDEPTDEPITTPTPEAGLTEASILLEVENVVVTEEALALLEEDLAEALGVDASSINVHILGTEQFADEDGKTRSKTQLEVTFTERAGFSPEAAVLTATKLLEDGLETSIPIASFALPDKTSSNCRATCESTLIFDSVLDASTCSCQNALSALGMVLLVVVPLLIVIGATLLACYVFHKCPCHDRLHGRTKRHLNARSVATDEDEFYETDNKLAMVTPVKSPKPGHIKQESIHDPDASLMSHRRDHSFGPQTGFSNLESPSPVHLRMPTTPEARRIPI